eukprot:scaffold122950_cov31-Tisochrysis_lutea.AAC.2
MPFRRHLEPEALRCAEGAQQHDRPARLASESQLCQAGRGDTWPLAGARAVAEQLGKRGRSNRTTKPQHRVRMARTRRGCPAEKREATWRAEARRARASELTERGSVVLAGERLAIRRAQLDLKLRRRVRRAACG